MINSVEPDVPLEVLAKQFSERDGFMRALGAELVEIGHGTAKISMSVREDSLNFNGTCHGGAIFALADCAFGVASNSYGVLAAGIDVHVTYLAAARLGDTLTATAREVSRTRKIAVYEIEVIGDDARLISTFTGTVYIIGKPNFNVTT